MNDVDPQRDMLDGAMARLFAQWISKAHGPSKSKFRRRRNAASGFACVSPSVSVEYFCWKWNTHSIRTNSSRYPWIDVGWRRPSTFVQRHDPAAAGRQLRVLLMVVMAVFFFVQTQSIVNVDRLLVSDVVDITRTLTDGTVFPIKIEIKQQLFIQIACLKINFLNKK